jgi:hypothetical protein
MTGKSRATHRMRLLLLLVMAAAVLLPSLYGFGTKFLEFVALYRGDVEGAFAVSPIINYLLASLGFLCLFGWAVMQGMFRDIEQPKYTLLENEARLERGAPWRGVLERDDRRRRAARPRRAGFLTDRNRVEDFYEHD